MDKEELRFIDRLYKDLYLSDEVLHHSTGSKTDKYRNIKEYLEKLEDIHDRSMTTEARKERLKKLYHDKYIIKVEEIPDSYYETQQRIALERGFGHVEINEEQKKELQKEVIDNQTKSLDTWLDYFLSEDSKVYPFWAKYWAFQGMLKLGTYNKQEGKFNKRTNDTVAPFADLNRETLAISIDAAIRYVHKEEITDKDLEQLVKGGSFQRVYTYILKNVLSNNQNISKRNEGKWVKYNQGSDHMPLVKSLQGYNTGWCTAGESTAKSQLSMGDFYVYYTLDENNEYKVPRIAIRMENDEIGEIRGIVKDQNIEPEMEKVVEEKIKDFPDKDKYYKKVSDMKKLTEIYNKQQNDIELTIEELRFLYELDSEIEGFGWNEDPRIYEIKNKRVPKKDLSLIFNCKESEVALIKEEIQGGKKVFYGDLDLYSLKNAEGLELPQTISGSLDLRSLTSAEGLKLPQTIDGGLYLNSLTSAEGLKLPQTIDGGLYLNSLTSAKGLTLPQTMGGYLDLRSLKSAEGLKLPQTIGGGLCLSGLKSAEGLIIPDPLTYTIHCNGFDITPENVDEYRNKSKGV